MSWKPEVIADSSGQWCGNGLRFATRDEAAKYVADLEWRWLAVRDTRVVQVEDVPTHSYVDGKLEDITQGEYQ